MDGEAEMVAEKGRARDLYNITKAITNKGKQKMAALKNRQGETIKEKNARMETGKEHFSKVLKSETPNNPIDEDERVVDGDIEFDVGDQRRGSERSD